MKDLQEELAELRVENANLRKGTTRTVRMKVGAKGGLSIYGLGRFPVTLYREQWLKLLELGDDIRRFLADNADKLKIREAEPPE